jgi:hypothetical protein
VAQKSINDGTKSRSPSLWGGLGLGADRGRLKQLGEGAYTQKEAEAAVGLSTDKGEIKQPMDLR